MSDLKWMKVPLDFWLPEGLTDYQQGWFVNLLRASLRSEPLGYLTLCEEGCSGCPACLWKIAGAHRPEYFAKKSSLVMARFEFRQIAGRRIVYFPPLVSTVEEQLKRMRQHKGRFPKNPQECTEGAAFTLPLDFDVGVDSKETKECAKKPPARSYAQSDFDARDWRKLQAELEAIYLPLQGARIVDEDPAPAGAYSRPALFREACRRAGLTMERGRSLVESESTTEARRHGGNAV